MRYFIAVVFVFFIVLISFGTPASFGGDLDDGISKYTDDGISQYDELGKVDKNVKYLKMRALSRARMGKESGKNTVTSGGKKGQANMNSVILAPGSTIKGDVVIIDESHGAKTQVVDK